MSPPTPPTDTEILEAFIAAEDHHARPWWLIPSVLGPFAKRQLEIVERLARMEET